MSGVYFHIPFCKRICAYCDFYKSADLSRIEPLLAALHGELVARQDFLHDRTIGSLYIGGGTPSLCSPTALQALIDHSRQLFDFCPTPEITVECNPDDLTPEYLTALRCTEVNRLSIGVQSFDDAALKFMNRRHTARQAVDAIVRAQQAGFENITIDLIFGVPDFGLPVLRATLLESLALGVQHISAYHLTLEPNTAFGRRVARGALTPVQEQISVQEFDCVHQTLTAAGFEHYEVSNYALPGRRAQHNSSYWTGAEYLGIGPAAHSFDGDSRCWCEASVEGYLMQPVYQGEKLSMRDHFNEYLMTSLRTSAGVDLRVVSERFGADRAHGVLRDAHPFLESGSLQQQGDRLSIPPERFLLSDAVIGALFDA